MKGVKYKGSTKGKSTCSRNQFKMAIRHGVASVPGVVICAIVKSMIAELQIQ